MSADQALVVLVGSSRLEHLAGGRLSDLGPGPALEVQLRRLAPLASLAQATLVFAASDGPVDDESASIAEARGWTVVRGAAADPLSWLTVAHARHPTDAIAIVRDDAPLSDPFLVLAALRACTDLGVDHASNLVSRTHPRGLEVEALSARALRSLAIERPTPGGAQLPTGTIARHPERFRLAALASGHDLAAEDWSLGTRESAARAAEVLRQSPRPSEATWSELLAVAGRSHRPRPGEVRLRPEAPPEPGSAPWVRRWTAWQDGVQIGVASLTVEGGRSERTVQAADDHREPVLEALYRLLLDDLQVAPPGA